MNNNMEYESLMRIFAIYLSSCNGDYKLFTIHGLYI
jgi:hypothetical protein